MSQHIPTKTASSTATIGARFTMKSLNVRPPRLAMMMFGGSPISVEVPPMLLAITSAIRNGTGEVPSRSQMSSVTGATSSTVVTLSRNAESTAVISTSMTMIRNGRPFARFAAQIARYSNTPLCCRIPTMIIMPSSRKMTFQSMPLSSEKKIDWSSVAPMSTISAAPTRATVTRGTFSVAMRM